MIRPVRAALILTFCARFAGSAGAAQPPAVIQRLFDLTPERLDAFKSALHGFGDYLLADDPDGIWLESAYLTEDAGAPSPRASLDYRADDIRVPVGVQGRDLVAEEQFLIAGREDDFEDAARWWVERQLKGEAGAAGAGTRSFQPQYGWNGGPEVGFRLGHVTTMVRPAGWKVRWSHGWASRPGWSTRVSCGVNDGDERVALTVGRSLFRSRTQ